MLTFILLFFAATAFTGLGLGSLAWGKEIKQPRGIHATACFLIATTLALLAFHQITRDDPKPDTTNRLYNHIP